MLKNKRSRTVDDKNFVKNDDIEIDLRRIIAAIFKKLWIVILVTIVAGGMTFFATKKFITPLYESKAMFYVNNSNISLGDTALSITTSDISASRNLVNTYLVVLKARSTLTDVIDYADVGYTYDELKEMITASAVEETEIFEVIVTSTDAKEADKIVDAITYILPKKISNIIEGTSAKIVDYSIVAAQPSSPNVFKNTFLGAILGMMLAIGVIALREIFDVTIRNEEDITSVSKYPILASIPDMLSNSKDSAYSAYYDTGKKTAKSNKMKKDSDLIGANISFTASEAYKMLRAKVQFSFADEKNCYVVGVSSALAGEGKSNTAANLAYSLSQLNKKVLLIDCDMRKPSVHVKLGLKQSPGISNFLTRHAQYDSILQTYSDVENRAVFNIITAGTNPPNPVELLSSSRMAKALEQFKEEYEYIILDLPPIGEVTDAMAASKHTDGMLIVSRINYGTRPMLGEAIRQFDFVDAKILGIVATCTTDESKGYGKGYYKKYYKYS